MDETFDPVAAGAVAVEPQEAFDPAAHGAVPVEQPKPEGGVLSGIASGLGHLLNPVNLARGILDIQPRSGLQEVLRTGRMIGDVFGGASPEEAVRREAPEVVQQQETLLGKHGVKEQAAEWTGLAAQTALLFAPYIHGKLAETAGIAKPETAAVPTEPVATDAVTAETHAAPVAPEVAQPVPEAVAPTTAEPLPKEPFPSILQSAEDQRRAAQSVPTATESTTVPLSTETPTGGVTPKEPWEMTQQEWQDSRHTLRDLSFKTQDPLVKQWVDSQLDKYARTHEEQIRLGQPTQTEGVPNAIQEPSASSILQHPQEAVGTTGGERIGVEPSVQGETPAGAREGGPPQVEGAAAPEVRPEIPEGAKVTLNVRNTSGEFKPREMDAREAEGIFTKEKSSYKALLDCLGA